MFGGEGLQLHLPSAQATTGTPTLGCSAGLCGIKTVASLLQRQPERWGRGWHCQSECSQPSWAYLPT